MICMVAESPNPHWNRFGRIQLQRPMEHALQKRVKNAGRLWRLAVAGRSTSPCITPYFLNACLQRYTHRCIF
ncbi:hypothetical protein M430DRAFT_225810 [Amorphotheca resinae ATCC 22711]|uniref:Uncharacterized protein n=1 Tax=Amorphotheca resinae ATCC 22711 TaxID=857342 RepID=A0A2T3B6Q9_AMORE|nr:hypothetical protein M430DRAFT_225810 [Amorphotheca resinae ATCC 22711]PSS22455.1 hypothetical protein M430DRAFT_225810 [Amorphotheca resinae ATCC 22711]